jgi:hypothetical protein
MDRRMYRGTGANNCGPCNRGVSPGRQNNPVCGDIVGGYKPEDTYDRLDEYAGALERYPLGMCYVPWQRFRNLYENEFEAIAHGTLFKELDLEFYGRSCK